MDHLTSSTSSLDIPASLEKALRPHQVDVLHFLWHRLVDEGLYRKTSTSGLLRKLYDSQLGAIIGHSMGLGKTLSALSFLALLQQRLQGVATEATGVADGAACCPALRVIVMCPRSCVEFWREAYDTWMRPEYFGDGPLLPLLVPRDYNDRARAEYYIKEEYYAKGGILVVGYEEYLQWMKQAEGPRRLSSAPRVHSLLDELRGGGVGSTGAQCYLLEVLECADVVVFDEAHRLRHQKSALVTQTTRHIRRVPLRLALTGTPLQNHLEAYMVMRSVVTGDLFDKKRFRSTFVDPINKGQCSDCTYHQFLEMQKCVSSLRSFFNQYVHHCGAEVLEGFLPHRSELIVFTTLSDKQDALYRRVLEDFSVQGEDNDVVRCALALHQCLSHLCLHPCLLRHYNGRDGVAQKEKGILASALRPIPLPAEEEGGWVAAASSGEDDNSEEKDEEEQQELNRETTSALQDTQEIIDVTESPKLQLILNLTDHIIHHKKEKVVIFSHYVSHLALLQRVLHSQLRVSADIFYGFCSNSQRRSIIKRFNEEDECRVLLCSIRAGGVGINLTAANHCILTDVSWNPTDDTQATYRIYRFGQTRPVNIYRLATYGTTEQVVFSYALGKSWLHRKVADIADPQRQQRHIAESYYTYPCQLPIKGIEDFSSAEAIEADVMRCCEEHCPDLAAILQHHQELRAHVRCALPHTFLLKDDEKEVIASIEQKFSSRKNATERVPIVLYEKRKLSSSLSHTKLIDTSEGALLQFAQRVVQLLTSLFMEHTHGPHSTGEEAALQLAHMMFSLTGMRLEDLQQRQQHALNLEYTLRVYVKGVDDLFREKLNTVDFADMRASWVARVPQPRTKHGGSQPHKALVADLVAAVKSSPFAFFSQFAAPERTFMDTELGFSRPFVVETFLKGMRSCLFARLEDPERLDTLKEMAFRLSGEAVPSEVRLGAEEWAERAFSALEAKFDVIWPAYGGFELPPVPMNVEEEERNMRRAYVTAYFPMHTGLFRVADAANILKLRLHASNEQRRHSFFCRRCPDTLLQRSAENGLWCPRCHYSIQSEVRQHPACHHEAQLFQLSSVCNKVCGFSLRAAMGAHPPQEAGVNVVVLADWLTQNVPMEEPPLPFIATCLQEGVDVLLTQFPSSVIFRVSLQCGTGYDLPLLRRLLLSNSHLLWTSQLRKHTKSALSAFFRQKMTSALSSHARLVGMPIMMLLLALYSGATTEELTYSAQLLEQERCDKSIHCALLRYAADTLVRLLYLEKLRRLVLNPPARSASPSLSLDSGLSDRIIEGVPIDDRQPPTVRQEKSPFPGQKRARSPTPCSPLGSSTSSGSSRGKSSSSFGLRYSEDRSSFASAEPKHSGERESSATAKGPNDEIGPAELSVDQLRYFWEGFTVVYGMTAMQSSAQMAEALPLPPTGLDPTALPVGAVSTGMKVTEMLDMFFTKLLALHALVPLMAF